MIEIRRGRGAEVMAKEGSEAKRRSDELTWPEGRNAVQHAAASLESEGKMGLIDAEVMAEDSSDAFINKAADGTTGTETSQDPGGASTDQEQKMLSERPKVRGGTSTDQQEAMRLQRPKARGCTSTNHSAWKFSHGGSGLSVPDSWLSS